MSESGATTTLPATSFDYIESDKDWTETSGYNIPVYFYAFSANTDRGVETADVNGDGLLDLLNSSYIGSDYDYVYLNAGDGTGWFEDSAYDIPVYFYNSSTNLMKNARMADFNGDGLTDIFYGTSGTDTLYKADKDSYTWTEETASPPPQSLMADTRWITGCAYWTLMETDSRLHSVRYISIRHHDPIHLPLRPE